MRARAIVRPVKTPVHAAVTAPALSLLVTILIGVGGLAPNEAGAADVPIVFVSRHLDSVDPPEDRARLTAVEVARTGRLLVLEPDDTVRTLVDSFAPGAPADAPIDVLSPDVSWDGGRVVFSGFSRADQAWRIFEINSDGTGLRQVTRSNRQLDAARYGVAAAEFGQYDDLDPCYLPDGRICFVSTRYPGSVPEVRSRATNLYVVNADGSGAHRITSERFGGDGPAVDPQTGKIVFSRWWRTPEVSEESPAVQNPDIPPGTPETPTPIPPAIPPIPPGSPGYGGRVDVPPPPPRQENLGENQIPEPSTFGTDVMTGIEPSEFPGVNSWFLASINPDGTDLQMFSGFHLDRQATQAYMPSFHRDGEDVFALFLTESPVYGLPGPFGLRRFQRGITFPTALGGPQTFDAPVERQFVYSSVAGLPDGLVLVTGSRDAKNPGAFDVFVQRDDRRPTLVFSDPDTAELDAVPLVPRARPPVIRDRNLTVLRDDAPANPQQAREEGGTFTFFVENIFANGGVDLAIPNAPPVGQSLAIEFFMAPQRKSFPLADSPILLQRVPIPPSGRVEVELPAGVPLFEVLRRGDGTIPVGRDGQIFHVGGQNYGRAGEVAKCVGCHVGHSLLPVSAMPARTNFAPSARVTASSVKTVKGNAFRPELLVDRRTDFFRSEWAADDRDPEPGVRFQWNVPIRADSVIVYSAKSDRLGAVGARTQRINAVEVRSSLRGFPGETVVHEGTIAATGTRIRLGGQEIDELRLLVTDSSGSFEGGPGPALAEVEVLGTAVPTAAPEFAFLRGDSNCDGDANLSDAVTILDGLFRGGDAFCCKSASDVNNDHTINLSDPVYLLNTLFLGGPDPDSPYPDCGRATHGGLPCDVEVCR